MAEVTEQITRYAEDPRFEAIKLDLLKQASALARDIDPVTGEPLAADKTLLAQLQRPEAQYRIAGFQDPQLAAIQATKDMGIGAFDPYLTQAGQYLAGGYGTTGEAADILRAADTRSQFGDAATAMRGAATAAGGITGGIGQLEKGAGLLDLASQTAAGSYRPEAFTPAYSDLATGVNALAASQNLAAQSAQANLLPATSQLQAATQYYDPRTAQAFMNPYQQLVTDESLRQIRRQADIAGQQQSAQAIRSGAFGGTREGVQRAEMERNVQDIMSQRIAQDLAQNYAQAQQAGMGSFEAGQQRQLGAGGTLGQLGVQQAGLGQSAADIYGRSAGIYGNLAAQQAAIAGQEAGLQQNIASLLGQQAGQQGALGAQYGQLYGQQAGALQNLGLGIGNLAAQQFGIGQQQAAGLGALGQQYGQLGVQQAALGQTAQAMRQGDLSYLYGMGQAQQAQEQKVLDAQRATAMQQLYSPYQQAAFLSDIYKGAPSSQMATTQASTPQASPFQQVAGTALGVLGTYGAGKVAGVF
jgi:hypothetical protein